MENEVGVSFRWKEYTDSELTLKILNLFDVLNNSLFCFFSE